MLSKASEHYSGASTIVFAGALTLKLPPRALEYVAARLQTLQQLQNLKTTNTVDYLRWFVSDLQDYKRLEKLQRVLESLTALHVVSATTGLRCSLLSA